MSFYTKKIFKIGILIIKLCSIGFSIISVHIKAQADIIAFSFNRPLQLYAWLESVYYYITDIDTIVVLVRASTPDYIRAYMLVAKDFPLVQIVYQDTKKRESFKRLLVNTLDQLKNDYILFSVDDIVVKDYVSLATCIGALEKYKAYGFYLRLGLHLRSCYTMQQSQEVPLYELLENDICSWSFKDGMYDWAYPHTLDMTLYRKKDIVSLFKRLYYHCPNTLEGIWSRCKLSTQECGLFFRSSKIVNIPINRVQQFSNNINLDLYSSGELLTLFYQNLKLDIHSLYCVENEAAHLSYWNPIFVARA